MQSITESIRQREALKKHNKLPAFRNYFERVTTTTLEWTDTWCQADEWKRRFGNRAKVAVSKENTSFLEVLTKSGIDFPEIPLFMTFKPGSPHWESEVLLVEEFCEGADFIFRESVPDNPQSSQLKCVQEPRAWVSDRNWFLQDAAAPQRLYGNVLSPIELYEILRKKRFCEKDLAEERLAPFRRVYISNPDGASIMALLRTVPTSQADGVRELFANYITPSPAPNLVLREDSWDGGSFVINFNLPFFAICPSDLQDKRAFSTGKQKFRARYKLDFLIRQKGGPAPGRGQRSGSLRDEAVLHESVFAFVITGPSERHCATYCLDDNFLDEDPRLEEDEEISEDGNADPIIFQAELKGNQGTKPPRLYALTTLGQALLQITRYHQRVQKLFREDLDLYISTTSDSSTDKIHSQIKQKWSRRFPEVLDKFSYFNSRLTEKVDKFLAEDVQVGPDGLPQGSLWRSLQADGNALRTLRAIKEYRNKLGNIGSDLEQIEKTCEKVRRERKIGHAEEQQSRDQRTQEITIAAFVLGILNLVAQAYTGKPERGDSASWPGYLTMVMFLVSICFAGLLFFLRAQVSKCGGALWSSLSTMPQDIRDRIPTKRSLLEFGRGWIVSLQDFFGWLWVYLGAPALSQVAAKFLERTRRMLPR